MTNPTAEADLLDALRRAQAPLPDVTVADLRPLVIDGEQTWTIAAASARLGVSAHTLRYYERVGLVRAGRDELGHRRYDAATMRRLVFLTRIRISGMPIGELRRYVELVDAGEDSVPERLERDRPAGFGTVG